ncbi:MAG: HAMP domain-containing histidine kinase, partial [Anaerolineae bacterium]|nr:HAMP domain-containing histidine kinase [Anaerolineae bacterium]
MTSTVRSRLWLSYVIVIFLIVVIVVIGILFSLVRNPVIRQSSNIRLFSLAQTTVNRIERTLRTNPNRLEESIQIEARARNARVLLVDSSGRLLFDSAADSHPAIIFDVSADRYWDGANFSVEDSANGEWSGVIRPLSNGQFAAILLDRPRFPLVNLFRDDVLGPIAIAGVLALVFALLITLGFSKWITQPLQRMAHTATSSRGDTRIRMQVAGPREVQEVAAAFNDLLARVEAGQSSQQAFLANISHELKTPLTSIQGFAQAIKEGTLQDAAAVSQAGDVIYTEADRMSRLVMQLMTLSRLESGVTELKFQPVDLGEIVKNIIGRHQLQAAEKCIAIDLDLQPVPLVEADGDQMSQVIGNLVDNAVKYTPQAGRIGISLAGDDRDITIAVEDSGPGIAQDDLERIFERFYQVDSSRRRDQSRGVGL